MLEVLIAYLNGILTQYGFANEYYELAERIEQGEIVFPGVYCGKDELKRIEFEREVLYHRQRSEISYSQNSTDGVSGCDDYVTVSVPLKLVAYVSRARQNDTKYSPSRLGDSLVSAIKNTPFGNLMTALEADDVQVEINNVNTSAKDVWEDEHENVEFAARHDHILLSVDYTVTVSASQSCLRQWECYENVTVTPLIISVTGRTWDSLPGRPVCLTAEDLCSLPMWDITTTDISNWNEAYAGTHPALTLGTPNGLSLDEAGQVLSLGLASASTNGALSSMDWSAFNAKVTSVNGAGPVVTLTAVNSGASLNWNGTELRIPTATGAITGLLSSTDWTTFNGKENVLTFSNGLTRSTNAVKLGGNLTENTTITSNGFQLILMPGPTPTVPGVIFGSYNSDRPDNWIYGYDVGTKSDTFRLETDVKSCNLVLSTRNGSSPRSVRIGTGINDRAFFDLGGAFMRANNQSIGLGATFAAGSTPSGRFHVQGLGNSNATKTLIIERLDRAPSLEIYGDHQAKFYGEVYLSTGNLRMDTAIAASAGASAGYITININGTNHKIQVYAV